MSELNMARKPRAPNATEKKHIMNVLDIGCIVCRSIGYGNRPAEIHHPYSRTYPDTHLNVIPLCFEHHRAGGDTSPFISRHPYKKRFIAAYGDEESLLAKVNDLLIN